MYTHYQYNLLNNKSKFLSYIDVRYAYMYKLYHDEEKDVN